MDNFNRDNKKNIGWSKQQLFEEYKKEHSEWSNKKCKKQAELIYKELNKMNFNLYYNNKKYLEHNVPFSFNPLLEEGYFEEFRKSEQYQQNFKNEVSEKAIKMIIKDLDKEEYEDV